MAICDTNDYPPGIETTLDTGPANTTASPPANSSTQLFPKIVLTRKVGAGGFGGFKTKERIEENRKLKDNYAQHVD
jgi:hypothetical protein